MKKIFDYVRMYTKNATVRLNLSMLIGIVFNVFYIIFNLVSGIIYSDAWPIAVAAYYMLILSLRYLIISNNDAADGSDTLRAAEHNAGVIMLIIGVPITGMIIYNVLTDADTVYSGAVPIVLSVYSVVSIARAISAIIRLKGSEEPKMRIAYAVRISAAAMSVFNFQSSALSLMKISSNLKVLIKFSGGAVASMTFFSVPLKLIKNKKECQNEKNVAKL